MKKIKVPSLTPINRFAIKSPGDDKKYALSGARYLFEYFSSLFRFIDFANA